MGSRGRVGIFGDGVCAVLIGMGWDMGKSGMSVMAWE